MNETFTIYQRTVQGTREVKFEGIKRKKRQIKHFQSQAFTVAERPNKSGFKFWFWAN